jgi:AraC-like DNA-binding protein
MEQLTPPNHFWFTPDQRLGFQRFKHKRQHVYPSRLQDEYVIVLCMSGRVTVAEGDRVEQLHPGEVLIGNSRQWRTSCYGEKEPCEGLSLIASRRSLQSALRHLGDDRFEKSIVPVFPGTVRVPGLSRIAEDVLAELGDSQAGRSRILEVLAEQLLVRSLRSWPVVEVQRLDGTDRVLSRRHFVAGLDYMQARSKSEFTLQGLCENVGLSVAEFTRLFRRCTASTPLATYNRLLIGRAVEAFRDGANSVKEVAYVLGFESPSHFTSLFRKVTGLSPSEVRAGVPFAGVARKWFGGLFA